MNKKPGSKKILPKGDTTQKRRQQKRTLSLNQKAQAKGWDGISEYLTAIINGEVEIMRKGKTK